MPRRRARRALTQNRSTFTMNQPDSGFHPHYFTHDTPHVRINDGYQRPYRSQESWFEIDNPIGWAERQTGQGGGLGSDRHTDRLMNGIGWAGAVAIVVVPGLLFPPWLIVGTILLVLSAFSNGVDALAAAEDRARERDAIAAARAAQMPHAHPRIDPAFGSQWGGRR